MFTLILVVDVGDINLAYTCHKISLFQVCEYKHKCEWAYACMCSQASPFDRTNLYVHMFVLSLSARLQFLFGYAKRLQPMNFILISHL